MEEKEEWKQIDDYPDYSVSSLGRIRRDTGGTSGATKGKILRICTDLGGYSIVRLTLNKIVKTKLVHRIVAKAFVPNPRNLPVVNHKLGEKADNRASQLEWMTTLENNRHASRTGLLPVGENHYSRKRPELLARGDSNGSRTHPERLSRGDNHYSRKNPDKLSRGDAHYTRTNPELVMRGEKNGKAKMSEEKVRLARTKSSIGKTSQEIADLFNVSPTTIERIVRRKTWKHVI